MHTDVNRKEIEKKVAQSAYCVDAEEIATTIIVRLATGEPSVEHGDRSDPSRSAEWEHRPHPAA
jgi:hypothetical protein